MALTCPHCSRTNVADARYCYYDGISLVGNGHASAPGLHAFATPFVFPGGRRCTTFDEFAHGCLERWDDAASLLQGGSMQAFFGGIGRMDLVMAAQEAAAFPDRDRGLDMLLTRLPTRTLAAPKLEVRPKLIQLGAMQVGETRSLELHLEITGGRPIFGSIVSNCKWLAVSDTGEARLFQYRQDATIVIPVKGQHLRAALKPLEGNLFIETNAGTFKLKVLVQVPIQAYPDGVLAGARTPRELAEKAKTSPKQAAPAFESGAVAKWYQANGWTYPVQGPPATGLAAVQQFFEALGLSKPPTVQLSERSLQLKGKPGTRFVHRLQVRGEENRPVYAHATSAEPWVVVRPSVCAGTVATIPLEITVPEGAGQAVQATVKIQANGNQQFDLPIAVRVEAAEPALAAAVITAPMVLPARGTDCKSVLPVEGPRSGTDCKSVLQVEGPRSGTDCKSVLPSSFNFNKLLAHTIPLAMLGMILCGLVAKDMWTAAAPVKVALVQEEPTEQKHEAALQETQYKVAIQDESDDTPLVMPVARFKIEDEPEIRFLKQPKAPVKVEIKDEPAESNVASKSAAVATTPLVSYLTPPRPRTFGISCTEAAGVAAGKPLTYARDGSTNTTTVKVNGVPALLGSPPGKWSRINKPLQGVPATPGAVRPSQSTWTWGPIVIHQVFEIVPGQPVTTGGVSRRYLDSVLIRWVFNNKGPAAASAGLRLQLDTLIGNNDGVPFTVPGYSGLVKTFANFPQPKFVPDFIQALENPSLKNPGTVAHMTLKVGGKIEAPSRVILTHWPGDDPSWDIPVLNLGDDSAVVLYWPEKRLPAGESRTIGFSYGLGNVSSNDKLGVTLGGSFDPGQNFTVTAYVENPIPGQTLRLELPGGLKRMEGAETQKVAGGQKTSIVTWKVLVERTGEFRLKVLSSTGLSQAKTISIAQGAVPTGGKLSLDLQGSFEPGQSFTVLGKVNQPLEDQSLTLHVPAGLEKVAGAFTQKVPAPPAGSQDALVTWKVRVKEPGKYPLRVSSSSGVAQTKTITIVQPGRAEGAFQMVLSGDFAPGKVFTVSTKVVNPAPNQKLTLMLPAGLQRIDGKETQVVRAGASLAWKVRIQEAGKFPVGLKSTTGVTQRKTLVIEPPAKEGGRFTFDLAGDIRPGKEFRVIAQVVEPVPGQTLTLTLPKGLQLKAGAATQTVGPPANVTWTVRVAESGRLPVRIESSTGLARTKTIQLSETKSTLFGQ